MSFNNDEVELSTRLRIEFIMTSIIVATSSQYKIRYYFNAFAYVMIVHNFGLYGWHKMLYSTPILWRLFLGFMLVSLIRLVIAITLRLFGTFHYMKLNGDLILSDKYELGILLGNMVLDLCVLAIIFSENNLLEFIKYAL